MNQTKELIDKLAALRIDELSLIELDMLLQQISKQYERVALQREAYIAQVKLTTPQGNIETDSQSATRRDEVAEENESQEKANIVSEIVIDNTVEETVIEESLQPAMPVNLEPHPSKPIDNVHDTDEPFIVEKSLRRKPEEGLLAALGIKKDKPQKTVDVRRYIGLNDQLQYLHTLFAGSNIKYNAALDEINRVDNATDAKAILKTLIVPDEQKKEEQATALQTLFAAIDRLLP